MPASTVGAVRIPLPDNVSNTPELPVTAVLAGSIGGEVGELPLASVAGLQQPAHDAAALVVGDVHGDRPAEPGGQPLRQRHESHDDEEVHRRHRDGEQQQACAGGHADGRGLPHGGRGGQPVHRAAAEDDDARTEKADARDDLGRDTGRVDDDEAVLQHIGEAVLADEQDQRRGRADDGLGAHSRALALDLALQPDQRRQSERDEQLDDLPGTLSGAAEERRIRRQPEIHGDKLTRRRSAMTFGAPRSPYIREPDSS